MRNLKLTLSVFVALLTCVFLFQTPANAQTINGNIVGVVTDEQGAAIPGVTVTVTNIDTGQSRTAETNEEGLYRVALLPVGPYSVRAEKSGFGVGTVSRVDVTVSVDSKADFQLKAGGVQEEVTVVASGALLETTQSQVSKSVDQTRILELPGRNSLNGLALLNPGVLPNQNGRPGSGFAVNGNRTRSNNFTIDGANNNDQSLSIPRQNLPPEAIQEFQIITNTFAAEFGRNAGSYVNQITRSGTNEFHGTGFYTWQGNGVDALTTAQQRSFNANRAAFPNLTDRQILRRIRDVSVDNVYGFTAGGPIKRNHTFFFTSIDYRDLRQTISSVSRPALTAASRATLQANRTRFGSPAAIDFLLNTFPVANDPTFAGGTEAGSTITLRDLRVTCPANNPNCNIVRDAAGNPLTIVLQTFNRTLGGGLPYRYDFDRYLGKINTKLNDKDQLSFRYLIDQDNDPGSPASLPGLEIGQRTRNQSFTINDVYAITPTFINEARVTYSRRKINFPENLGAFVGGAQLTVSGSLGAFSGGNANFPQSRIDNVYEFTENMSYSTGNHNLKWGANVLRYQLNSTFAPNSRGFIQYNSFNALLADQAALIQKANGNFNTNAVTYENGFFAQDDYRFNPDLTFNLGLRYEYVTTPFGFFSNAKSDIDNFGPSVGLAWNPKNFADGRFVFRGGFRKAYDQVFQNILLNVSRNFPRVANFAVSCAGCAPFNGFTGDLGAVLNQPPSAVPAADRPFLSERLFSPNARIRQPESYQWTVSGQYQFGNDYVFKAEYIGTKGSNLVREVERNFGLIAAAGGTGQRLDPTRGSILVGQGIASSIYHSGQFTLEKRFSQLSFNDINFGGLTFNANFTYSMFISESDDVLGGQTNRTIPADPRNPGLDRARSGFDQPRRFVASYVYATPELFRENAFLNRVFSGWEIAGVTTLADGTPFSVLSGNNALGVLSSQISTVQFSQRVLLLNPSRRDNSFTIASVTGTGADRRLVFPDPNARFALLPENSGFLGNLGANTERTGGTANTNLSLVKNIRTFSESQRLQLRAEVFNIFNRRNFTGIPSNTLSATTTQASFLNFGLTNVGGRSFIFGARYFF